MNVWKRWSWLCLVAVWLCATAWAAVPNRLQVVADQMVHVFNDSGHGVGTMVSPSVVVTAWHVYETPPTYAFGQKVESATRIQPDTAILKLSTPHGGVEGLALGVPKIGPAAVVTMQIREKDHKRLIYPITIVGVDATPWGHAFVGYRPVRGQSGSPVVQGGRIVGVVSMLGAGKSGYFSPVVEAK